jgi:outer membrane receptor protein involved in Fe transport
LLLAAPLSAQRVTGQISGTVEDDDGAVLPGVTASVTGDNIAGDRVAITNASGFYRFLNLPPGSYEMKFQLEGFASETRSDVRVALGQTTTENVKLEVGDISETIVVTADAAVVDTSSNEVGANYGRDWVENAPVKRLSFNDLVAAAPGSLRGTETSRRTMVYGSSYDENSFQLDGADVNDNFFNEQQAQPSIDAIEEIEVLSLGAPAEYGNLTGAVYNIVTRQGTNQYHGDLNFFTQSDDWTDSNTDDEEDGGFPFRRDEYTDYSLQVGGPIAKDRLWFFGSYQHTETGFSEAGVDPSIGTSFEEDDRFFGKLNLFINESHSLQLSYHRDEIFEDEPLGAGQSPSTKFARDTTTPAPSLGYTGVLSDETVIDVRFTGFYADVFLGPSDPNQPLDLPRFYALDTGFISGGHYYWYDLQPERTTVNTKVSHLADDFLGASHEFRFGVQYNESEAGGVYGYNDLILTYGPGYDYGYGYTRVPFSYSGNTEAWGVFVDDTVRVNDRLTLNFGVRWDSNKAFSREQQELDADLQPTGVEFPEVEHYTWEYISPRLGFNYQLTGDGRTVLKGHVGRYHRAIATGEFANVIGPSIKPIFAGFYDLPSGTFFDLFQITDNSNLTVDPRYDSPRTDQYILTLERQLANNIGLNLNLVHKRGRDFGAWRDFGGIYDQVTYIDDVGEGATGDAITLLRLLSDPSDLSFVITNRPEMDFDIYAASLGLVKPMSNNWSLSASLTWLQSEGRTPDSGGPAGAEQRGGLQFRTFGRNPNDFVLTGGRLRGDIPWQFKSQLVYQLPKDFLVSVNLSARTGANLVRRIRPPRAVTNLSQRIFLEERGDVGRLPSQNLIDVRVEKSFGLGSGREIAVFADVFNLLNDDSWETVVSSDVNSSTFNEPTSFVFPRRVQLGAKFRF